MEKWVPAYGIEDRYEVSDRGRVRNLETGHILIQSMNSHGYLRIRISIPGGEKQNIRVHRLVASSFIRPPSDGEQVNHIDFDRSNNSLENLEWVSHQGNVDHARLGGRMSRPAIGDQVIEDIKRRRLEGQSYSKIAEAHGLGSTTVVNILKGRSHQGRGCLDQYRNAEVHHVSA